MEEKKEVVEETTEQPIEEVKEEKQPRNEKGQFTSKFKSEEDDTVYKVDLSNPPEEKEETVVEEVVEQKENVEDTDEPIIEEITEEEKIEAVEDAVVEAVEEAEATGTPLPENIQKLVDFMEETGGDIQDYVNLNKDISSMDDSDVLDEYYRSTKSHLSPEERSFLLEDNFGIDEEIDDEKTQRKKKIALKEQVAEARAYLDGQKSKYYEEIKAGSKLTEEQQKAINFYNESEENKKESEKRKRTFLNKTDSFFGQNFKGFEYNVGDKKYRFNIKDVNKVKEAQSDINNFVSKFANKDNTVIEDTEGYHKSLYTAMNADAIAKHFYEQGKADAIKGQIAQDKNINLEPRKTHGEYEAGGLKVRVLGDSSSDFKFKIKSNKRK
tara:strand:+ start:2866 stop:4011 length:1146 start_codon:yes stop_codon:yes gene_type:complete